MKCYFICPLKLAIVFGLKISPTGEHVEKPYFKLFIFITGDIVNNGTGLGNALQLLKKLKVKCLPYIKQLIVSKEPLPKFQWHPSRKQNEHH